MKRRAFITLLDGVAAWPLAARGQQAVMPLIGYLSSQSASADAGRIAAMRQSLAEAGYAANLTIEYRWAEGDYDRLAAQAAEFVRRRVAVIFAARCHRRSRPRPPPRPFPSCS